MRTDIDLIYRGLDLFVLPSHREGFPRAAMEAASSGLPVVATDIRGCREVVEHEVNGLLVPVKDPDRLAEAIVRIGTDPALARRMGLAGVDRARRLFDETAVVKRVMATYRRVATLKGLDAIAKALDDERMTVALRPARADESRIIARLHISSIGTGFLSTLGVNFLDRLYRALIQWPGAVVLVADHGSVPVGFVAGVADTTSFYRHFLLHHGFLAGIAALPELLRPSQALRAWETLSYNDGDVRNGPSAELLAMAVRPDWRGRGLGTDLGLALIHQMSHTGPIRVVVGSENHTAIRAYQRMGFRPFSTIEVHRGSTSSILTWEAGRPS